MNRELNSFIPQRPDKVFAVVTAYFEPQAYT